MGRISGLILLAVFISGFSAKADKLEYRYVDRMTYYYYTEQKWDSLIELGEEALDQGIDYYYLRMRIGIAYFEMEKYLFAAVHFRHARKLNPLDNVPVEYLYYSYLDAGKYGLAHDQYRQFNPDIRHRADSTVKPGIFTAGLETGPIFSSAEKEFQNIDLDGKESVYGEADFPGTGFYSNLFVKWRWGGRLGLLAAYTFLGNTRQHHAMASDTVILNENINQSQHQVYVQVPVNLGKGFSIIPAYHYLSLSYTTTLIEYDGPASGYRLVKAPVRTESHILHLAAVKDLGLIELEAFGASSNLNGKRQYQVGAGITAWPSGNLNFWSRTVLLNHNNDGTDQLVFEQSTGFRALTDLWGELFFTIGPATNYYNRNAYIVYNSGDVIKMTGGTRWTYYLANSLVFSVDYKFLWRNAEYIQYSVRPTGYYEYEVFPMNKELSFITHIILGGITWKL